MERRKLTELEISESAAELPGWDVQDGKLKKQFKFDTFSAAIGWMVSVAIYADKIDHHPNWSNVYNRVNVELWTHDLRALTTLDLALAKRMNILAGE